MIPLKPTMNSNQSTTETNTIITICMGVGGGGRDSNHWTTYVGHDPTQTRFLFHGPKIVMSGNETIDNARLCI